MTVLKNYIVNPRFVPGAGWKPNLFNLCPNPSPTVDLTGWDAVGAATVARQTAARIKGKTYGARVTASSASDGIALPAVSANGTDHTGWATPGFSVYVRAVTACTLTIAGVGSAGVTPQVFAVGWGDHGWGEATDWHDGATITLAAGQTMRARLYLSAPNPQPAGAFTMRMQITGSGTYDVDGMWSGEGVNDSQAVVGGTAYSPPGTAPYFDGDTAADSDFTYSWVGAPYQSASYRSGREVPGVDSDEGATTTGVPELSAVPTFYFARATTRAGESVMAVRSSQWFSDNDHHAIYFAGPNGGHTAADLGLTVGQSYVLGLDFILDYQMAPGNYAADGRNGNEVYFGLYPAGDYSAQPNIAIPGRARAYAQFTVQSATDRPLFWGPNYLAWLHGEVQIANASLNETRIYFDDGYMGDLTAETDLMAKGVQAGASILVNVAATSGTGSCDCAVQALVGGTWTTLASDTIGADDWEMYHPLIANVPANATGIRLTLSNAARAGTVIVSDAPPAFFDGDTPAGNGYTYSWEGTPHLSASLATPSTGSAPAMRVFYNGQSIAASGVKVFYGGSAVNVSAIKAF